MNIPEHPDPSVQKVLDIFEDEDQNRDEMTRFLTGVTIALHLLGISVMSFLAFIVYIGAPILGAVLTIMLLPAFAALSMIITAFSTAKAYIKSLPDD